MNIRKLTEQANQVSELTDITSLNEGVDTFGFKPFKFDKPTFRIGRLEKVSADQLTKAFGKPRKMKGGDGKTTMMWGFTNPQGVVFTVYDYKNPPKSMSEPHMWSVGGVNKGHAFAISRVFKVTNVPGKMVKESDDSLLSGYVMREYREAEEGVEIGEASWGGGFETSREAQAKVQAGLKADYKRKQMIMMNAVRDVMMGKATPAEFKKRTGENWKSIGDLTKKKAMRGVKPVRKEEVEEQFKAGDRVKVPHKGKMVKGKIVRFDDGGTSKARQHGGAYIVNVGEPASIRVPSHNVKKEEVEVAEAIKVNGPWENSSIVGLKSQRVVGWKTELTTPKGHQVYFLYHDGLGNFKVYRGSTDGKAVPPNYARKPVGKYKNKEDAMAGAKKDAASIKESVEEGFAQPTRKELLRSVKWLESLLRDPKKLKASGLDMRDAKDNLKAAKDMLSFGDKHGSKVESVEEQKVDKMTRLRADNLMARAKMMKQAGKSKGTIDAWWKRQDPELRKIALGEEVMLARIDEAFADIDLEETRRVTTSLTAKNLKKKPEDIAREIKAEARRLGVVVYGSGNVVTCMKKFTAGDKDAFHAAYRDCSKIRNMVDFTSEYNTWGCDGIGMLSCIKDGIVSLKASGKGAVRVLKAIGG
jgi:hypothetical protein